MNKQAMSIERKREMRAARRRSAVPTAREDMFAARMFIVDGIAEYEYEMCKSQACVNLFLGNLNKAISLTRTALFINRIRKQMT